MYFYEPEQFRKNNHEIHKKHGGQTIEDTVWTANAKEHQIL